jgi:hypothetical protein
MFHRFVFVSAAVLALFWATAHPGRAYAQHGHGGFSGGRPGFGGIGRSFDGRSFQPGFGGFDRGFNRGFFDPRFGRFDGRFDRRFFDPRFGRDIDRDFDRRFADPRSGRF